MHMNTLARALRNLAKWHFKAKGYASILNISEEDFQRVVRHLNSQNWNLTGRYRGYDAGVDYDCLRFRKRWTRLKCEWDNWDEWSIQGPAKVVSEIASAVGLEAKAEWRWAKWDSQFEKSCT